MDWSDLFGYLLAALWLLGPALRRRQQQRQPQPEAAEAPRVPPSQLLARAEAELRRIEAEAVGLRQRLDPTAAAALGAWLEGELLPRLRSRRERIAGLAEQGGLAGVLEELSGLESRLGRDREDLHALHLIVERRTDPEHASTYTAAERLAREFHEQLASFAARNGIELTLGPPLPVVWLSRGNEPLLRSSLGAAVLPVPAAVRLQPWLWPALGQSLGRYLQAAVPGLRADLHEQLRLDARDEPLTPGSPALARVLFGAWSETLLADFAGALLFGPAYLRMLVRSLGHEDPRAVTTIGLDQSGALLASPPPHARVRLTGHWLAQMGLESTALGIVREWEAEHDAPALFHFGRGAMAPLPAQPLMEHLESLTDRADLLAFPSLARTELGDVPGLAGWNGISGQASQASRALGEGKPRPGTTRALLAGAALAAFEAPARAGDIDRALHASLAGEKSDRPGRRAERPAPQRRRGWDATRVTEALLFGELLLEPRSGRSR